MTCPECTFSYCYVCGHDLGTQYPDPHSNYYNNNGKCPHNGCDMYVSSSVIQTTLKQQRVNAYLLGQSTEVVECNMLTGVKKNNLRATLQVNLATHDIVLPPNVFTWMKTSLRSVERVYRSKQRDTGQSQKKWWSRGVEKKKDSSVKQQRGNSRSRYEGSDNRRGA